MIGSGFEFADLQKLTGNTRPGDVERCLKGQGIRFMRGKDGIWTTLEAVNAGLGIAPGGNDLPYRPDDVI